MKVWIVYRVYEDTGGYLSAAVVDVHATKPEVDHYHLELCDEGLVIVFASGRNDIDVDLEINVGDTFVVERVVLP